MNVEQIIQDHIEIADRHGLKIKAVRLGYLLYEQLSNEVGVKPLAQRNMCRNIPKYLAKYNDGYQTIRLLLDTDIRDVMEFIYEINIPECVGSIEGLLREAYGEIETALGVIKSIREHEKNQEIPSHYK